MSRKKNAKRRLAKEKNEGVVHIDGAGNYFTDVMSKIIPRGTFAKTGLKAGGALGNYVGGLAPGGVMRAPARQIGSFIGDKAGQYLAKLVGFGDYSVVSNSLTKIGKAIEPGQPVPTFGLLGTATVVRHREFITDIVVPATPAAFTTRAFVINPGDASTFPWLSAIAQRYQQYKMNGIVFEFRTLTSETNAGGPMGAVILATNYDVLEVNFPDKIRMENSQYAISAKPSCTQIHTVECAAGQVANSLYYVRSPSSSATTSQDARFYDLGKFQIATAGLPGTAGQTLGELWVSYDVSLFKPEVNDDFEDSEHIVAGAGTGVGSVFGVAPTITGAGIATATGNLMTFQRSGQFLLSWFAGCTVPTLPVYTGTANFTVVNTVTPLATTTTFSQSVTVIAVTGQTLNIDTTAWATSTGASMRITNYRQSLA